MSTISYMPFNEIEDYVDELEEKIIQLENENSEQKNALTIVADILDVNTNTTQFKFNPEAVLCAAIEELQNAQTTKQS